MRFEKQQIKSIKNSYRLMKLRNKEFVDNLILKTFWIWNIGNFQILAGMSQKLVWVAGVLAVIGMM